jgi:hypothetical protein
MAHPAVEKLKDFGIRHGEKVGVAVVSAVCLLLVWLAITRPSVTLTADEIAKATERARQNLNREQKVDAIVEKIRTDGIVAQDFEKIVDERTPGSADASRYALSNVLAAPEPGAGLLRDQPTLLAVAKLQAHAGRGAARVFETDAKGELIPLEPEEVKKQEPKKSSRRNRNTRGAGGMMGGMMGRGGMGGGYGGMMGGQGTGAQSEKAKREEEKRHREQEERIRKSIGGDAPAPGTQQAAEPEPAPDDNYKKRLQGFRWVALTGVLDHKRMRENFGRALKIDPSAAHPHYLRTEVDRQRRNDDGTWSDWAPIDRAYIEDHVWNLYVEEDNEEGLNNTPITPPNAKLDELADPLPFLEVGYWVGVHHGDLIDPKALEKPKTETSTGGTLGRRGGGFSGGSGGMMGRMMGSGGPGGGSGGMTGGPAAGGSGGMMGRMMGSGGMMGRGGMMGGDEGVGSFGSFFSGGSAGSDDTNFSKTEAEKVMVRALDFTAEPDAVYRYRVRVVVRNPNYNVDSVQPGVDKTSKELAGPWSDPTEEVAVPPDVQAYVLGIPAAEIRARQPGALEFGVVRWNESDGLTITKTFFEAPGEIIGEPSGASVPLEERDKTRLSSKRIDFTSRRLLVDASDEAPAADRIGVPGGFVPVAQALLLRPDGMLVLRDEAGDRTGGEWAEMVSIYNATLKDVDTEKKSSTMPYGGMMGGMMGPGGM